MPQPHRPTASLTSLKNFFIMSANTVCAAMFTRTSGRVRSNTRSQESEGAELQLQHISHHPEKKLHQHDVCRRSSTTSTQTSTSRNIKNEQTHETPRSTWGFIFFYQSSASVSPSASRPSISIKKCPRVCKHPPFPSSCEFKTRCGQKVVPQFESLRLNLCSRDFKLTTGLKINFH